MVEEDASKRDLYRPHSLGRGEGGGREGGRGVGRGAGKMLLGKVYK